jgi:hypothetical protein
LSKRIVIKDTEENYKARIFIISILFVIYLTILLSHSDYIASNERVKMNDELEDLWKEAVVTYFKVLFLQLRGEAEENHVNPQ